MARNQGVIDDEEIVRLLEDSEAEDESGDEEDEYRPDEKSSSSDESEDDEPEAVSINLNSQSVRWKKRKFSSKDLPSRERPESVDIKSPAEYFEQYFTEELYEKIATATSQYYIAQKGVPMKPNCSPSEIKKFFGIHGIMGCVKCPRIKMYWHQKFKYDPIATAMTRERFFTLRVNLHAVDPNKVSDEDKNRNRLWKIQPIIESVRNQCLSLPREYDSYSIDEQMIPFSGRCAERQYVPNKPRPVGLKNFLVTSTQGLVLDFEIYQGTATDLPDRTFGLGPAVVLRLARTLPGGSLFFDRYFTTVPLMRELIERKLDGTGTLMTNRFKKDFYEFKSDREMKRGEWEEVCSPDGKICAVKWMDNKSVLMVSTIYGAEPSTTVSRWDKKNKAYKDVTCPSIVSNYNRNMGGVDLCDQMVECYRTWFKTRKWTLKVILHLFDLAVVNSWFEYRRDAEKNNLRKSATMDLLFFRLSIADYLIGAPTRKRHRDDFEMAEMPSTSDYRPAVILNGCSHQEA